MILQPCNLLIERLPVLHQHFHPVRKGGITCGAEFGMVANNVSEYDYDKSFGTYHTSKEMAGFLLKLYDSEKVVGLVDRESFSFRLSDPLFPYAGNSAHNQQRM